MRALTVRALTEQWPRPMDAVIWLQLTPGCCLPACPESRNLRETTGSHLSYQALTSFLPQSCCSTLTWEKTRGKTIHNSPKLPINKPGFPGLTTLGLALAKYQPKYSLLNPTKNVYFTTKSNLKTCSLTTIWGSFLVETILFFRFLKVIMLSFLRSSQMKHIIHYINIFFYAIIYKDPKFKNPVIFTLSFLVWKY